MSELKMISPMMDGMIVEKEHIGPDGQTSYILREEKSGERYVLNILSLPENDSRIRALILSGAYENEDAVHAYYGRLAEDIKQELNIGQQLAASGCFAGAVSYHAETKPGGVGYDLYILYPLNISLAEFLAMNAMTGLRALNLGIDLCEAIITCRQSGYLHMNLKPETVFLMPTGRFLIGGLGLTSLEFLEYASVPEEYIGAFSAPEMSDIAASPNLTIDLYAIGMILYLIYNGNHGPFEDESTNAAMADRLRLTGKPLPSPIYADYELAEIIMKACAFKKEDRYQSPDELKQALILYMQRNAISDDLIAPPIVADLDPVPLIDEEIDDEPIRMTEVEDLDEDFRQNFAPDLSGAGDDTYVPEPKKEPEPVAQPEPKKEPEPAEQPEPKKEPEPAAQPEPKKEPEPVAQPEPIEEPKSAEEPEPIKESAPEAKPEPARKRKRNKKAKSGNAPEESPVVTEKQAPDKEPKPLELSSIEIEPLHGEPSDPDQMDFDALLASVDSVINKAAPDQNYTLAENVPEATVSESDNSAPKLVTTPVSESAPLDDDDYEPPVKKKKHSKRFTWTIIAIVLLGLLIGGYLLLDWYFIDISEMYTVSTTPSQITVELSTRDNPSHFTVTCSDSFGNVHNAVRSGSQYCFMNLREKTSYSISVKARSYHDFSSAAPVLTETTNEYTTISNLSLERLNIDGDVLLTFDHKGPEPSQWKISYAQTNGTDKHSYRFDGESYQINGLELNKTYTITLDNVDNVFIQGENSIEYDVYPRITATNFAITDIVDSTVSLAWECGEVTPEQWYVTITPEGGKANTVFTETTFVDIPIFDFSKSYTFTLSALGMDQEQELVLDANPIIVSNLAVNPDESGNLVVTWDTPSGEPNGQWRISYRLKDGYYNDADGHAVPSVSCDAKDANSITLRYLPANAQYELTLMALDTQTNTYPRIFGTTTIEASTPDAIACTDYQIQPAAPYGDGYENGSLIALWQKPEEESWDYRDLTDERRTAFTTADQIAMCIQIDSCDLSASVIEDTVHVTYVVRRASHGGVIMVDDREMKWESVWFDRRHTGVVPMPLQLDEEGNSTVQTGQFLIEVYINGKLLASKGFTVDA